MKKVLKSLGVLIIALLLWYFFIKQHDYRVRFQANTNPGTISQTLKTWSLKQEGAKILSWKDTHEVTQKFIFGDSTHTYTWRIKKEHDSLSSISVYITDKEHSIHNKFRIPFTDTNFEKRSRKTILAFGETLISHLENFKIEVVGAADSPGSFCACTEIKTTQFGKADGMMANYGFMNSVIAGNNIQLNGPPMLQVTEWNKETDSLTYDFCYPIIRSEKLPRLENIEYRRVFKKPSLKAKYYGNYITSDRAWYALEEYANSNGLEVSLMPIEVFFKNPNMGINEKEWLAEIYIPLKEQE